jgi:protein-S-isoprenylcysteine O-methyltransferase Ste14
VSARTRDPAAPPLDPPRGLAALPRALLFALAGLVVDAALFALALGGLAPLLAHPLALALLAIWTTANVVLAALRPVRRQDTVAERADARFVLIALGLLPLIAPPVSALGERLRWAAAPWDAIPAPLAETIAWAGVALTALGLAIRITAMTRLGARFSPLIAVQREHALETTGLYARVRHPGYLGTLLAITGAVLTFQSMLAWPLLAIMYAAQTARARREESLLENHFGDPYRAYKRRTGRFLPRLNRP